MPIFISTSSPPEPDLPLTSRKYLILGVTTLAGRGEGFFPHLALQSQQLLFQMLIDWIHYPELYVVLENFVFEILIF